MKKTLLLFLAGAFVLAGCDKNNEENGGGGTDPNAPKIAVTPPQVNATYEGGDFTVNYTVENPVDGANVSATPGDAWVKVTSAADGVINFTVDAFTETENRSTLVEVVYDYGDGTVTTQFNVVQSGVTGDVTSIDEISLMQIAYLGRVSSDGFINAAEGPYGYQVQLVDKPLQDGYLGADAVVMSLVFLSDQAPDAEDLSKPVPADKIILPDGDYTVGAYGAGNIWAEVSGVDKVNSTGDGYELQRALAGGSMTITNNGSEVSVSAKITDAEEGVWDIEATVAPVAYEGRFSSTLEGDVNIDLEDSDVSALYYGVRYEDCDLPVWSLQYLTANDEILQFEFVAPAGSTFASGFPIGTFTAAKDALNANTFVPGFNQSGRLYASWFMTIVEQTSQGYSVGDPMAPLVGGTVEISKDGSGNYTVKVNATDDIPYNITATWTGVIEAMDGTQQYAPTKVSKVSSSRLSLEPVADNLFRK